MKIEEGSQGQNVPEAPHAEVLLPDVYVHPRFTYYPPTGIIERGGEQFSVLPRRKREGFNELFLSNPNRAVSPEEIIDSGYVSGQSNGINVWISQLRKRLSPDPKEAMQILVTVKGKFVFRDESRPVELIQQDPEYVDFHVRVKRERADQFEEVMDQFGRLVTARRLAEGSEVVLFTRDDAVGVKKVLDYPNPEIDPDLPIIDGGDFKFDPNTKAFLVGDKRIPLSPNEAKLAYLLTVNNGRVVTKDRMRNYLQNFYGDVSDEAYRIVLTRIRTKLRKNIDGFVDPFETISNVGVVYHGPSKTEGMEPQQNLA